MNLTSKRMLQFIAGSAGAVALSATAQTTYVADNFEYVGEGYGTTNGVANMPISTYKCQPYGTVGEFTNYQWFVESSDDVSKLVNESSAYSGTVRPIVGSTTLLALNLETNGKTLVRTNNASLPFGSSPVYVDTLIKFTPSEDNPTITDASVKAAVFLDANLHLWVYHGGSYVATGNTSSDTGLVVSTNEWHRLTIMLGKMPGSDADYAFKVYIDQAPVSCAAGMADDYSPNGPWFYSASVEGAFAAIAFQGTGLVDELVVADSVNLAGDTAVWLTLSFNPAQVDVTTNGIPLNNLDLVKDPASVVISAKPWYEITSGGTNFTATSSNLVSGTTMVTNLAGTVTGPAGVTNEITSAQYSQSTGISTGLGGSLPADKVAAWAIAQGLTTVDSSMLNSYLLNVATNVTSDLKITSITYGPSVATIKIAPTNPSVSIQSTAINGTLNIWTTDNLVATPFSVIGTFVVTVDTASELTVTVPVADGKFIKATIETAPLW